MQSSRQLYILFGCKLCFINITQLVKSTHIIIRTSSLHPNTHKLPFCLQRLRNKVIKDVNEDTERAKAVQTSINNGYNSANAALDVSKNVRN